MTLEQDISTIAIDNGATCAGITSIGDLRSSPSFRFYEKMPRFSGVGTGGDGRLPSRPVSDRHPPGRAVLVIGLSHPAHQPQMDWLEGGNTAGNRRLMEILSLVGDVLENRYSVRCRDVPYRIARGGLFLKDAAVFAGLGCIGRNNLLITPSHGPRVRLRATLLDVELSSSGSLDFDPCSACDAPCRAVCPRQSLSERISLPPELQFDELPARDGCYDRLSCNSRMEKDVEEARNRARAAGGMRQVRYCRNCELICPAGKT